MHAPSSLAVAVPPADVGALLPDGRIRPVGVDAGAEGAGVGGAAGELGALVADLLVDAEPRVAAVARDVGELLAGRPVGPQLDIAAPARPDPAAAPPDPPARHLRVEV